MRKSDGQSVHKTFTEEREHLSHRIWSLAYLFRQRKLRSAKGLRAALIPPLLVKALRRWSHFPEGNLLRRKERSKGAPLLRTGKEGTQPSSLPDPWFSLTTLSFFVFGCFFGGVVFCYVWFGLVLTGKWEPHVSGLEPFIQSKLKCFVLKWEKSNYQIIPCTKINPTSWFAWD